ncbi:MAG: Asp23/Gls24 family envelope stress response protein [Lachnospiraceae bacterium]|nr:Asp23/Gls24 family envelope stress response protein [Lachnospiraceae bacterium]
MAKTKEIETNEIAKIELDNEFGEVEIADDVIASIAGLAATEVEGVASMNGNITRETLAKLGIRNASKGVKIDVQENLVNVSLTLSMRYGYSIPKTSEEVQKKVKDSVENMTGLSVSCVDVRISGIELDKE